MSLIWRRLRLGSEAIPPPIRVSTRECAQMTAAPEQNREVAATATQSRISALVRMAGHLRSSRVAAVGADRYTAAIMELMKGPRIELTSPHFAGEARPVGARPSR